MYRKYTKTDDYILAVISVIVAVIVVFCITTDSLYEITVQYTVACVFVLISLYFYFRKLKI